MANWCEGTLQVWGEQQHMKRFLLEAIDSKVNSSPNVVIEKEESLTIKCPRGRNYFLFTIPSATRTFIDQKRIKWNFSDPVLIIKRYKAAWCIDLASLVELSTQYQVNLRVYGYEEIGTFKFDVEIHCGHVMKSDLFEFESFDEYLVDTGFDL